MSNNNRAQLFKKRLTPIQTNNLKMNTNTNNIILVGERNPNNYTNNNNNMIIGGGGGSNTSNNNNNGYQLRELQPSSTHCTNSNYQFSSSSGMNNNYNNNNGNTLPALVIPSSTSNMTNNIFNSSSSSSNTNNISSANQNYYLQQQQQQQQIGSLMSLASYNNSLNSSSNSNNSTNSNYNSNPPNIHLQTPSSACSSTSSSSSNQQQPQNFSTLKNNPNFSGGVFIKQQPQQQTIGYLQPTTQQQQQQTLKVLVFSGMKSKGSMSDLRYSVESSCTGTTDIEEDIEDLDNFNANGYLTPDEQGLTPHKVGHSPCDEGDEIMESIDSLEHHSESRDTPTSTGSSSPIKHNLSGLISQTSLTSTPNKTPAASNNQLTVGNNNNRQSNLAKKRPQNLSINKSDLTQSNNFVGPHTDFNTSPVKNQASFRVPSPINSHSANFSSSSNNSSLNNSLVTGASNVFFVPSASTEKGSANVNSQQNTPQPMSIHTFSSQPSPSHHLYFKNKKVTTPSHSSKIARVPTPTAIMVNDIPVSDSKYGKETTPKVNISQSKHLPPLQRKEEQPSQSHNSPRLPKQTTPNTNEESTGSSSAASTVSSNITNVTNVTNATNTTNNDTSSTLVSQASVSSKKSNSSEPSSKASTASSSTRKGSKSSKKKDKTIKNYKKGDFIGSGASGKVFLGYNLDDGKFFAIKECTFDSVPEDILELKLQSLQREINLMKELCHENIVQYYGAEVTGTTLNIFLEYVPGGSVSSLLRRYGRLSEDVVRHYTTQILKGLKYLHENRIVHRDIKGANILVSVEGAIKLADFGASRKIQDIMTLSTEFKSLLGTPHFMAPEVIMQTGHGRSADIWSIGCTVVEMYTGKPPFTEFTTAAAVMFHIAASTEMPSFPEFVSEGCKKFLAKCFIRDPNLRATVDDLLNDPWILQTDESDDEGSESVCSPAVVSPSDDDCINAFTPSSGSASPFPPEPEYHEDNYDEPPNGGPKIHTELSQEMKEKKPLDVVKPKKGYNSQKDISIFLRKNSMWQSRSFSNSDINLKPVTERQQQNNNSDSSDFEDEEITNYFEDDFEEESSSFNGLSSMKTEYDPQDPQKLESPDRKKKDTGSKQKKVRRKLDEDLKKEVPQPQPQPIEIDNSPKKEKKKTKRKSVTQKFIDSGSSNTTASSSNQSDMDLFPVIEIPKKTQYQKEREKNDTRAKQEEQKIHLMEKELSKLDHSQLFGYQKPEKTESPKKIIPPIPHTSHSKSKSPARERSRIKSAPIKRVSCEDLSETLSPITQLGKVTSPTKTAPKQYRDHR